MALTPERLDAFKAIYQARFGRPLDDSRAEEAAKQLLRLMEIVYMPMRRDELAVVQERNRQLSIPQSARPDDSH